MGGGAGGHMWHPWDCPDVKSGKDLVKAFRKSAEWLQKNPASLKIDGVNLSFRLKKNPGFSTGFEFVVDRGSSGGARGKLDLEGVTAKNAHLRWINKKDPAKPHGMVGATDILLRIFNNALPEILSDMEKLGMTRDAGPLGMYFNTEFVYKETNVKKYPFDFIAIHGVRRFTQVTPRRRGFVDVPVDQGIINRIVEKVKPHAEKNNPPFKVYGKIETKLSRRINVDRVLGETLSINYGRKKQEGDEGPGTLVTQSKTLKQWLSEVSHKPYKDKVLLTEKAAARLKIPAEQYAFAKKLYWASIPTPHGLGMSVGGDYEDDDRLLETKDDVEKLVDAVVFWEATRVVGNEYLDASESEFGPLVKGPKDQEEGIVIEPDGWCNNTSFKYSGDFILDNLQSGFGMAESLLREQQEGSPIKKVIAIYPGRFHPPGRHHAAAYNWLKTNFGEEETYVATSDKVEMPKSPFTFEEKELIWSGHGVPSERVVRVKNPYKAEEIMNQHDPETTAVVYMVGSKDMKEDPRFSNLGGTLKSGKAAYLKSYQENKEKLQPLSKHGYLIAAPHMSLAVPGHGEMSGTTLRKFLADSDPEGFKAVMGFFDDEIHNMVRQTLGEGSKSNFLTMESLFSLVDGVLMEGILDQEKTMKALQQMLLNALGPDERLAQLGDELPNFAEEMAADLWREISAKAEGLPTAKVQAAEMAKDVKTEASAGGVAGFGAQAWNRSKKNVEKQTITRD